MSRHQSAVSAQCPSRCRATVRCGPGCRHTSPIDRQPTGPLHACRASPVANLHSEPCACRRRRPPSVHRDRFNDSTTNEFRPCATSIQQTHRVIHKTRPSPAGYRRELIILRSTAGSSRRKISRRRGSDLPVVELEQLALAFGLPDPGTTLDNGRLELQLVGSLQAAQGCAAG